MLLFTSASLVGCATDSADDEIECLPGDIDCAPADGADGKGDGFDFKNDPVRMSQRLNYRLAELPMSGTRTMPVWKDQYPEAVGRADVAWADTYWPTYEGGHNNRWQGASEKSPIEKYDAAFNNAQGCATQPDRIDGPGAKAKWDEYYQCAGPATKWQSREFQGAGDLHNGIDDDGDGITDDRGPDGNVDGIATWWGTCHAWAPASLMVPEPQQAVTVNGVTFSVGDIKALTQNAFDSTGAVMLGGRCNAMTIEHSVTGSANEACADVNPGALHVVFTNFLGIANLSLVEDRTANFEIWNQAVMGYDITSQTKVTASAANQCVGASGSTWTFNTNAKELFDVRMTAKYLTESGAEAEPVGSRNNIRTDRYHYILELNSDGKIIGGRYCTDSTNNHVDFLWAPTGQFNPSNPSVSLSKVKELIAKSVAMQGGGGGDAKVFTATGGAIPDNSTVGASVEIPVTGVSGSPSLSVSLNITHTYRGDLLVELFREGTKVKTLHDRSGGSQDNLIQTYTLTSGEVGSNPNVRWTVKVTDTAAIDTGTIGEVKLSFE
jgi:hypothetical protein